MKVRSAVYLIVVFLVFGCRPRQFDLSEAELSAWKPVFAAPLFETDVSVLDMMTSRDNKGVLKLDGEEGFLSLVYEGQFFELQAYDLIPIQGYTQDFTFNVSPGAFPSNGEVVLKQSFVIDLGNGYDRYYEMWLKGGYISFLAQNTSEFQGEFLIESPSIVKDGVPMSFSNVIGQRNAYALKGHRMYFNRLAQGYNQIQMDVTLKFFGTPGTPYQGGNLSGALNLGLLQYERLKLHISQRELKELQDTFNIPFFELENINGGVEFLEPKVTFHAANSVGASATFEIEDIVAKNVKSELARANFSPGNNRLYIEKPSEIGGVTNQNVPLDISETFSELLAISPTKVGYRNSIYLNDGGSVDTNFILDTSRLAFRSEIEMPLQLKFRKFDFSTRIPVDFSDLGISGFEYIKYQFEMINKFPIELRFQMIFLDENDQALDSLFANGRTLFKSGEVDSDGRVKSVTVQENEIVLDRVKARAMLQAKYARIVFGFNTFDEGRQWVKFYDDYRLGMKCKVLAKGNVEF